MALLQVLAPTEARSAAATQIGPAPRRPNIILILADDLGYGDLGCYGQTKIKTPNIDRLAVEGIRFTSAYAGSTVCAPSRCSLMTGLHTGHAFIRGNADQALRPEDRTMAELLKESGYHTGLVGKWGLGEENTSGLPQKKGFDEFVGYLNQTHAHDYYTDRLWRYDPATGFDAQVILNGNQLKRKQQYTPDLFTTAATNFVRINKPDVFNSHRPFFLFLSYILPHANNEEGKRTGNGMQVPSDAPYSSESWPQTEKNKAAMIGRLDDYVGTLLETLKQMGIDDDTAIFFTSDNGPHAEGGVDPKFFNSSGGLRGIKRDLYEGGIRVPMVVRWPKGVKGAQTSDLVTALWDLLPTFAEIGGAKVPGGLDGISFLPTLQGAAQTNRHEYLYWEFHERGFQQAARAGDWKVVRPQADQKVELYNLKADPAEKTNVAESNSEIVRRLEGYLAAARGESPKWPIKKPGAKAASTPPKEK